MTGRTKKIKPRPNLGEIAYDEIKSMILTGELEQGQRLVLDELSEQLNLSVTPIRDALNKLSQEDLVNIRPRTSHTVVQIDEKDASDILDLRRVLEVYALETAEEASLKKFPVKKYQKIFSDESLSGTQKKFVSVDTQFHNDLLALSPNQRLPRLYAYLQNLVQVLSIKALKAEGRIRDANKEHLELLEAIGDQDLEKADMLLNNHFAQLRKALFKL